MLSEQHSITLSSVSANALLASYHLRLTSMRHLCLVKRGYDILWSEPLAVAVNKPF